VSSSLQTDGTAKFCPHSGISVCLHSALRRVAFLHLWIDLFDAAMVVLAMYSLTFFHPGRLFLNNSEDSPSGEVKTSYSTSDSLPMTRV
jgi:hypothetical protein